MKRGGSLRQVIWTIIVTMNDGQRALSKREREVIRLVSLGCSVRQIAAIMGRAEKTVGNHKSNAMGKLGVRRIATLTRRVLELKISTLDDALTPEELRHCRGPHDGDDGLDGDV